ncbi:tyrosine-type recombinase/integrase [Myceligenerans xiligouense]|uniref:Site-specific recombinase XerD n=1 Tax=Myceligenerans xiligouense TaxID=253184 RepID=A0A3N4Z7K8_9MICO|nr:site-specific integrase [Myceligenerans xiligouense]RPF21302.1 site-specific recombinase XerD [Myceligenerans xiligouense]
MGKPRTPIGTWGDINVEAVSSGSFRARTWFRDLDGRLRLVQASSDTGPRAEVALKAKLAKRIRRSSGSVELSSDSPFTRLVEVWLEDLELDDLASSTRELYERDMRTLVLPAFKEMTLREITIMKVDRFLKQQQKFSYARAKHAKVVLNLALGLALRYEAIDRNPVTGTKRLKRPATQAKALSLGQVDAIRAAVKGWRRGDQKVPGPRPDGQLEAIIEVMIGSSLRIGEVLALRKCDVDLTTVPATVRNAGTIVSPKGKPTYRQPKPKTATSVRRIAVPSYTAEALRTQLIKVAGEAPDTLVFRSRNGTPLTTNNVRRRLRDILKEVGITGVTPHSFRRTAATTIDRSAGADMAAELLGHTSTEITKRHYIEPDENVNIATAQILEALAPGAAPDCASSEPAAGKPGGV